MLVRGGAGAVVVALTSAALAGCGSAAGQPGALPVPTFPATAETATANGGPIDQGRLPDDCTRVLGGNDLGALFGLPLDSVAVRTTIGTPAPSVGRTERLACQYTRSGGARDGLLDLNIGAYTDADAATKQWRTNVTAEDGAHRDVALGGAHGVLVERPQEAVLMVANGAETLTFVLPEPDPHPRPLGRRHAGRPGAAGAAHGGRGRHAAADRAATDPDRGADRGPHRGPDRGPDRGRHRVQAAAR